MTISSRFYLPTRTRHTATATATLAPSRQHPLLHPLPDPAIHPLCQREVLHFLLVQLGSVWCAWARSEGLGTGAGEGREGGAVSRFGESWGQREQGLKWWSGLVGNERIRTEQVVVVNVCRTVRRGKILSDRTDRASVPKVLQQHPAAGYRQAKQSLITGWKEKRRPWKAFPGRQLQESSCGEALSDRSKAQNKARSAPRDAVNIGGKAKSLCTSDRNKRKSGAGEVVRLTSLIAQNELEYAVQPEEV